MQRLHSLILICCCAVIFSCNNAPVSQSNIQGLYLLEDSNLNLTPQQALLAFKDGRFKKPTRDHYNIGFTRSVFWLAFRNTKNILSDSMLLYIGDHHINRIHFYSDNDSALHLLHTTGDYYPNDQKPIPATGFFLPIKKTGTYLVKIDKANESLQLFFWLTNLQKAMAEENRNSLVMVLLTGMMLMVMLFTLYLFITTKDLIYLYFIGYMLTGWLWVLANSGHGFQYLWGSQPWFASKSRAFFAILSGAISVQFMVRFVGIKRKWVLNVSHSLRYIMWILAVLVLSFNSHGYKSDWWIFAQAIIPFMTIVYTASMLCFLMISSWRGNRLSWFYLGGSMVLIATTFLQATIQFGGSNNFQYFFSHFGIGAGYIIESLIFLMGLAFRFNHYRRNTEMLLKKVNHQQQENLRIITEVQHHERSEIANQLHDVAGSMLSAARLNLSVMQQKIKSGSSFPEDGLDKTEQAIVMVSDMVRNLSHALSPVMLEKVGFKTSIEKVADILNVPGKLSTQLIIIGFETYKTDLVHYYTEIHGIVYELLNNVAKHSMASHVLLQLIELEDAISIIIEDNGIGFSLDQINSKKSLGLTAIQTRTEMLKGSMAIDKNFPQGTIITIYIPVNKHDIRSDSRR